MSNQRVGHAVAIQIVALWFASCGGGGGGGSPTGPDNSVLGGPGGFNMSGAWSGTLNRPDGKIVPFLWTATQDSANLSVAGPLTLTLGGSTATGSLSGSIGRVPGGAADQWQLNVFTITVNAGGVAGFPNCSITSAAGTTPTASLTSTTLTSNTFAMRYSSCQGLIDQQGQQSITETSQLTMGNTPPPMPASERWIGVAPDGWIIENGPGACTLETDLTLDLVPAGTTVTGTATIRERKVNAGCSSSSETFALSKGTIGSGTISFTIGSALQPFEFSGTFNSTRMTGTALTFGGRRGTWAVNRQ